MCAGSLIFVDLVPYIGYRRELDRARELAAVGSTLEFVTQRLEMDGFRVVRYPNNQVPFVEVNVTRRRTPITISGLRLLGIRVFYSDRIFLHVDTNREILSVDPSPPGLARVIE